MSEENGTPQIDLEKGVITLRKGEDAKSFKLTDENDLNSLVKLGQRGWYFDDEASRELGELRKVVKNWDSAIEAARKDDAALADLKQRLEMAVGRPLTRKEERQVEGGEKPQILIDEEENSRVLQMFESMQKEIAELKKSQADFKQTAEQRQKEELQAQIEAEASRLEKKFDGKDGSPKFERQKVYNFAAEKGIEDLELAFKMLNFDKLTELAQKKALKELKDQQEKRNSGFTETGTRTAELKTEKAKKRPTYHALGLDALKEARNNGLSLFTDD